MEKNFLVFFGLMLTVFFANAQTFANARFIVEANKWYSIEASSNSFSNSVDRFFSMDFSEINKIFSDIEESDSQFNEMSYKDITLSEDFVHLYMRSVNASGQFNEYFQVNYTPVGQARSGWARGLSRTAANLLTGSSGSLDEY